jgi:hypothetical protein
VKLQVNLNCKKVISSPQNHPFLRLKGVFHIFNTYTGLFKKKYTLSKIYFRKNSDAKSMSCVRMERKSLKADIDDLKRRITEAVAAVTCDMLR